MERKIVDGRTVAHFRKLLASYILVILLGLVMSVAVYRTAYAIASEQVRQNLLQSLERSRRTVDMYLSELDRLTRKIANNGSFRVMLAGTDGDRSVLPYRVYAMWNDLRYDFIDNPVIRDAYVYLRRIDSVISPGSIHYDPRRHYGVLYGPREMEYGAWIESLPAWGGARQVVPAAPWIDEGSDFRAIGYVRSFPLDHASPTLGAVVFLIAESTVHALFEHLPGSDSAAVAILNERGDVITAWGSRRAAAELSAIGVPSGDGAQGERGGFFDRAIGGVPSIVAWNLSERGDLVHVAAIPVSVVLSKIAYVQVLAAVLIAAFVAAGIAAGVVLARTNTRPFTELVEANDRLANVLHETRPQLRASLLNRLMRGGFQDEQELHAFLPDAGLPESDIGYRMIVARVSGYRSVVSPRMAAEVNAHRKTLLDGLQGRLPVRDLAFTFGDDTLYVLHAVSDRDRERDEAAVEAIAGTISAIASENNIRVAAGAGEPVRSLVDLRRSVDEAFEVTEYLELGGEDSATLFSRLPAARTGTYFYPLDVQARLENAVRSGHKEHLAALLLEIRRKNFEDQSLGAPMIRQLLSDMRGTYLRIAAGRIGTGDDAQQEPIGIDLLSGPHEGSPPEYDVLAEAYERLTECFHARKRSHNDVLWERILRHVDDNVHRTELCVTSASEAVGLNEDYFSRFFREQAGITFSHYVETRRLEQAERLLRLTDLSIDDITARCGYATSRTFRRAFKRRHGVSPSEARTL